MHGANRLSRQFLRDDHLHAGFDRADTGSQLRCGVGELEQCLHDDYVHDQSDGPDSHRYLRGLSRQR